MANPTTPAPANASPPVTPNLTITNAARTTLDPLAYIPTAKGELDIPKHISKLITEPLMATPLVSVQPVEIKDLNDPKATLTADDLTQLIINTDTDVTNYDAELNMHTIYSQQLEHYDDAMSVSAKEVFVAQDAAKISLPAPKQNSVYYTVDTDLKPSCSAFMRRNGKPHDLYYNMFVSFAYCMRPRTLGVYFVNQAAFEKYKQWLSSQINLISSVLPKDTTDCFDQLKSVKLNTLTQSFRLRTKTMDNSEDYSFARMLHILTLTYCRQTNILEAGIMPFDMTELIHPMSIVFINVEQHSKLSSSRIKNEWNIINRSLELPVKVIKTSKLASLTSTVRYAINSNLSVKPNSANEHHRVKIQHLPDKLPNAGIDVNRVKRIISRMTKVRMSQNTYRDIRKSHARPNRRDPNNYDLPGTVKITKYQPDLHLYVDRSGSISPKDYKASALYIVKLAMKMHVNMYYTMFSDVISETYLIPTNGKSLQEVWNMIQRLPNFDGGTQYEAVWNHINHSRKCQRQFSLMITDFGYTAPNSNFVHPKNLYYAPCSGKGWNTNQFYGQKNMCKSFIKSMQMHDPAIRSKILV